MRIDKICPVNLEYNCYNGFIFSVLEIEAETETVSFNGALFGIYINQGLTISLGFVDFNIKSPLHW